MQEVYKLANGLRYIEFLNALGSLSAFCEDKTYFKFGWGTSPEEGYEQGKVMNEKNWEGGDMYSIAAQYFNWKEDVQ